jgi:nicotinamidase-related amidase
MMKIPADKAAIVLIEPQNDFLSPGGTMYAHIKEQLAKRDVIGHLQTLLEGARGKVKIFYVPFHPFEKGFPELKAGGPGCGGLRGIEMEMEADWGTGAWLKGTPGPEIVDALRPKPGDIVVEGKKTLDAFHSTALDYLLRANEIEYVAFAGFHTNWCVESSARSAYDKGYRVIVISDCTGTDTQREQEYAEQVIFPKIGTVMTSDELLAALELGAPQRAGVA